MHRIQHGHQDNQRRKCQTNRCDRNLSPPHNTDATQQISTQGLASGVYIINLKAGDQAVSKKVIIQ